MTNIEILSELSREDQDGCYGHPAPDPAEQSLVPESQAEQKEAGSQESAPPLLVKTDHAKEAGNQQQMLKDNRPPVQAGRDGENGIGCQQHGGGRSRPLAGNAANQGPEQPDRKSAGENHGNTQRGGRRSPDTEYRSIDPRCQSSMVTK